MRKVSFFLFLLCASNGVGAELGKSATTMRAASQDQGARGGDPAGGSCAECKSCCQGLIPSDSWLHTNYKETGCDGPIPPGSSGSCVKCGDGKCDSAHFENKCNCAKDCP